MLTAEDRKLLGLSSTDSDIESQGSDFSSWFSGSADTDDDTGGESAMSGVFNRLGIETAEPTGFAALIQCAALLVEPSVQMLS